MDGVVDHRTFSNSLFEQYLQAKTTANRTDSTIRIAKNFISILRDFKFSETEANRRLDLIKCLKTFRFIYKMKTPLSDKCLSD